MATIFWDCDGVLQMHYSEKVAIITGRYYATILEREAIKEKWRGDISKGVLLLKRQRSGSHEQSCIGCLRQVRASCPSL